MREIADVVIIGGGPTGLSAAREAARLGLQRVVVLERESEAGGTPRHCGHTGFGVRDFRRIWSGPEYAKRLVRAADGADLRCGHAVTGLDKLGMVEVSGPQGSYVVEAKRVLLATGTYERPYGARLLSGGRPFGTLTTGALQRFVYLQGRLPCQRPVVIGSGWIAYSAVLTLRHMGVTAVAMIERGPRPEIPRVLSAGARMIFGVPMLCNTEISGVVGDHKVEGVILARTGDSQSCAPRILDCDAVIFSGDWVPEAALARAAGIRIDTEKGGPRVDANYRTDSPFVYAAGNVLRGARSAGFCALEGRRAVRAIVADLAHQACQRRGAEYPAEA